MLLKEIKLLELDDSITDNISSLVSAVRQGRSAAGTKEQNEVAGKFRKLFQDKIFAWRYNEAPYKRAEVTKYFPKGKDDPAEVEELINTLNGLQRSMDEAAGKLVRGSARGIDDWLAKGGKSIITPGVKRASDLLNSARALTPSDFTDLHDAYGVDIARDIAARREQLFAELSKTQAADRFATTLAQVASKQLSDDVTAEAGLKTVEKALGLFGMIKKNAQEMLDVLGHGKAEPEEADEKPAST